jgi:hypothetical protein
VLHARKKFQEEKIPPICSYVSFIETRQANGKLWMHGKIFYISEGWKGAQDAIEWFLLVRNVKLYT